MPQRRRRKRLASSSESESDRVSVGLCSRPDLADELRDSVHQYGRKLTPDELVEQATDKRPEDEELGQMGAYEMAATVDFGPDAKQGLLDLRSENARMRLLTRLFRAAVKRLDFIERAQARARSNGKVRFS